MKPRVIDLLSLNYYVDYLFNFTFPDVKNMSVKEKLRVLICRIKGHPNGPIYYTGPYATEPNMACKDCGEEL